MIPLFLVIFNSIFCDVRIVAAGASAQTSLGLS